MNHVLSLVQAARLSPDPGQILYSDHMLAELLALHEEMIGQLRFERHELISNVDSLARMIEQHEKTAAMLRAKLEKPGADKAKDGPIVVTGEASSDAAKSLVTKFAQGARGLQSVSNHMTVKS